MGRFTPGIQQQAIHHSAVGLSPLEVSGAANPQGFPEGQAQLITQLLAALGRFFPVQLQQLMALFRPQALQFAVAGIDHHQNPAAGGVGICHGLPQRWALLWR